MKNVAGYDVSRLMCGALGTLGVLLEVSLKVLPGPEVETTLVLELDDQQALARLHALARQALPVSASCVHHNTLLIRLSGTAAAVSAARKTIGGDEMNDTDNYWLRLREHRLPFFNTALPVWRVSLAATAPRLDLPGDWLYEWGGAQRWLASDADAGDIRRAAAAHGGHAVCFRAARMPADVFHPLDPGLRQLHARLKQAFDPARILNRGKMYAEI
jgi:glycolate oxidase FAD binding subunit